MTAFGCSSHKEYINSLCGYKAAFFFLENAKCDYQLHRVYLSVLPSVWNDSASTGRIFMKFDTGEFFYYLSRKLNFD